MPAKFGAADPRCDDPEREDFMAAVEDGLADLEAGRVYTHEEVIAEVKRRLEAIERGESTTVSLDDMMRRLRSKVRGKAS